MAPSAGHSQHTLLTKLYALPFSFLVGFLVLICDFSCDNTDYKLGHGVHRIGMISSWAEAFPRTSKAFIDEMDTTLDYGYIHTYPTDLGTRVRL